MATNGTTTDLIIRAQEIKTQPLDDLLKLLGQLSGALDHLASEGGPATKSLNELRSEAEKFETLTREISGRKALFETFRLAGEGAKLAAAGLEAAKRAQQAYNETLPVARKRTEDQKAQLKALTDEVKASERALKSQERTLASASDRLSLLGISTEQVAAEFARLGAAEAQATAGFDRATRNVQGHAQAVREAAAANRAAADEAARSAAVQVQAAERLAAADREIQAANAAAVAQEQQRLTGLAKLDAAMRAQREQELAAAASLRELGQQSQQAAAATTQLVAATDRIAAGGAAPAAGLAQQVQAIVQPAKAAALSLDQVSAALTEVEGRQATVNRVWAPSRDLLKALAQDHTFLAKAQRETADQAAQLDSFRKLRAEFDATGSALTNAKAALELFAAEARRAGTSDDDLEAGLKQQRQELAALTAAYQQQGAAVGRLATNLRAAGVDVSDLAKAEQTLLDNARRITTALDATGQSTTRLGQATSVARKEFSLFGDETRTALSFTQRLRGQILSLTAAYVGLFGVINEAKAALEASTTNVAIRNKLAIAFGDDPAVVAQQLKNVRDEANRLGLDLANAAQGYSKFAVAARAGGLTADETFFVFKRFSEMTRSLKLGTEETGRVFKALEQIMSKGKIQAEELRGQLGDVLPGIVPLTAKALGLDKPGDLDKALEKGIVSSKNLLLIAQAVGDKAAPVLRDSTKSWQAELGRLSTALFDFRTNVANSGFADAMTNFARMLREMLGGPEGTRAAQALSEVFSGMIGVFQALLPVAVGFFGAIADGLEGIKTVTGALQGVINGAREFLGLGTGADVMSLTGAFTELGRVMALVAALWVVNKVVLFAEAIRVAEVATIGFTGAVTTLGTAIQSALILPIVALVAYDLGKWANDNFVWVKKVGLTVVNDIAVIIAVVKNSVPVIVDGAALVIRRLFETLVTGLTTGVQKLGGLVASGLEAIGAGDLAKTVLDSTKDFGKEYVKTLADASAKAGDAFGKSWDQMATDVATVIDVTKGAFAELDKVTVAANKSNRGLLNASEPQQDARVTMKPELGPSKPDARAERKREAIDAAVSALEARSARKSADELSEVLAAIDLQYKELFKDIAGLDAATANRLNARARAAVEQLKEVAKADFNLKDALAKQQALTAERDAKIELVRLEAELDPSKRVAKRAEEVAILIQYRQQLLAAASAALAAAEADNKVVEAAKQRAVIAKLTAQDPEREARAADLADLRTKIQLLVQERDAKIEAAVAAADIQDPTGATGMAERVRLMTEYRGLITDAAIQARELALAQGDTTGVAQLDAMIVRLQTVDTEAEKVRRTLGDGLVSGLTDVGVAAVNAFADIATNAKGAGSALADVRNAFKAFARSFIDGVIKMIVQTQVLAFWKQIAGLGGSTSGAFQPGFDAAGTTAAAVFHSGGMVGSGGFARSAPASVWAGAPRMHNGGLPGLKSDERAAILQVGEEVLSKDNPRNVRNMASSGPAAAAPAQGMTIINTIDPQEVLDRALASPAGQRTLVNAISVKRAEVKKLLS